MGVTTTSLKRHGLTALLLIVGVLFHVLCSAGHAAEASESALGSSTPTATATTAQPLAGSDPAATPHVHLTGGTHECADAAVASADPRGSAPTLLSLLLAVGLAVLIAPWAGRPPAYIRPAARRRRPRRRNAAPLLLALCVWRI
ncbi:hypothetical protein [Nocardiopsis metallicus]|uniref:Uncharacterized protein n=1 Tax=Nocardiopsis metallicus TaxID=179819 RepID=A0A840WC20_9ACTN|nr:hypothetical protein [Nocardiopsis metallicus]MBB5494539.1 hypothetical protein [Nocardiopsis metallicus]